MGEARLVHDELKSDVRRILAWNFRLENIKGAPITLFICRNLPFRGFCFCFFNSVIIIVIFFPFVVCGKGKTCEKMKKEIPSISIHTNQLMNFEQGKNPLDP